MGPQESEPVRLGAVGASRRWRLRGPRGRYGGCGLYWVLGLGFRLGSIERGGGGWGLGFRLWGLGLRVEGLGFRACLSPLDYQVEGLRKADKVQGAKALRV